MPDLAPFASDCGTDMSRPAPARLMNGAPYRQIPQVDHVQIDTRETNRLVRLSQALVGRVGHGQDHAPAEATGQPWRRASSGRGTLCPAPLELCLRSRVKSPVAK